MDSPKRKSEFFLDSFVHSKKSKTDQVGTITKALKQSVWELYFGPSVSEATCPLCGITRLHKSSNNGFQAAHIVAQNYFIGTLTRYNLVPSCASCNNQCRDYCLFEYLFARHRYKELKHIAWTIWCAFIEQNPDQAERYDNMMYKFIYDHYGVERYPAGGGITSERNVYEILRAHQVNMCTKEMARISTQLYQTNDLLQKLLQAKINKRDLLYFFFL